MAEYLATINKLLSQPMALSRNTESLIQLLKLCTDYFEDPLSIIGSEGEQDELRPLLSNVLRGKEGSSNCDDYNKISSSEFSSDIEILGARLLKILLRKPVNRASLGKFGMNSIITSLKNQVVGRNRAAAHEVCNVVLNSCYDGVNVPLFIDEGGVAPLINLLCSTSDSKLQGRYFLISIYNTPYNAIYSSSKHLIILCVYVIYKSALGAMQGICYIPKGRQALRQNPLFLSKMSHFLQSDDELVRARATGTVHNLSVDIVSMKLLRENDCILPLVELLQDESVEVVQAASGALQNLTRDSFTKQMLLDFKSLPLISKLLFCGDIQVQVSAAGILINLLQDELDEEGRRRLQLVLTDGIVLGAVNSCVFES